MYGDGAFAVTDLSRKIISFWYWGLGILKNNNYWYKYV
jgi:hypothetical protein